MPEDAMAPDAATAPESADPTEAPADPKAELMERVVEALRGVYDPEIPVNIWDLGLVYRVDVDVDGNVQVDMTLTAPTCPVAGELPIMVEQMVEATDGVTSCNVELVWDPPWNPTMMSEAAKVQLDMF